MRSSRSCRSTSPSTRREKYALLDTPKVLVTVDDDLAVGEFGIATRLVAPPRRRPAPAAPPPPSLPLDQPAQTMIYKAAAPVVPDAPPPETQREVITLTVAGRTHEVTSPSVVLGRSREADVRVADVNVSRRHAELRQEGELLDRRPGSTNGVEVNGKHVDRARLRDGDRITIGATEVVFGRASRRDARPRNRRDAPDRQDRVSRAALPLHRLRRALGDEGDEPGAAGEHHPGRRRGGCTCAQHGLQPTCSFSRACSGETIAVTAPMVVGRCHERHPPRARRVRLRTPCTHRAAAGWRDGRRPRIDQRHLR